MSDVKINIRIAVIPTLGSYGGNDRTRHSGSSSVGRVHALGAWCRRFESSLPDKYGRLTATSIVLSPTAGRGFESRHAGQRSGVAQRIERLYKTIVF